MSLSNSRPAVFLDRDGTLSEDRGQVSDPSQLVLYPGTVPALLRLQEHFTLFVVTNQSGVARGLITREDVDRVNARLLELLAAEGIRIAELYVCPHQRTDGCECIKPKPYFPLQAARIFGVDLARSFSVGDHPGDVQLGLNVGGSGVFVLTGHGAQHVHEIPPGTPTAAGIAEAAAHILSSIQKRA